MKYFIFILITVLGVFLCACSGELEQKEYVQYIKNYDHGLHVRSEQGELIVDVQFQPSEWVALQRIGATITVEQLKEITEETSHTQFYTLTLQYKDPQLDFINAGVGTIIEHQQKIYYFSYGFQDAITLLEEDGSELPCVLYHFEKNAHLDHSRTFVLGFENPLPLSGSATLVIRSSWLGNQPVKISISKKKIPSLKI